MADIPIVGMVLQGDKLGIAERTNIRTLDRLCTFGHHTIDATAVGEVDGVAADVRVMPVKNVDASFGTGFEAEANPSKVVHADEVFPVTANKTGPLRRHDIGQQLVLVDIAHEKLVSVFRRKGIGKVEACAPMCGEMPMITNSGDVIVDVRIQVRLALFVIDAALDLSLIHI